MIRQTGKTWHLQGKDYSYVLMENADGDLLNFHFGGKIPCEDYSADQTLWQESETKTFPRPNLSAYPQEYPSFGHRDQRDPAYIAENRFGNTISRLKVKDAVIHAGEAFSVPGMPCLIGSADTLEMVLEDDTVGLEVRLYYVVMEELNTLGRSAVLINRSSRPMKLHSAYSMNFDCSNEPRDLIYFPGGWGRERRLERQRIHPGMKLEVMDTTGRGDKAVNSFVMLADPHADEETGEVYGFSLIYSANHSTVVQADEEGRMRVHQGINPLGFGWELKPGEQFATPQSVLGYSSCGIGELSRQYHKTWRTHLMRSKFRDMPRPVLINSWESFYFDFDEDRLVNMARQAKDLGVELLVLDDGWFGHRDAPNSSLGDWIVNEKKLPSGIGGLAKRINDIGMQFGIWVEPEMISPDSDLYRAHPDWAIHVPQREPLQLRNQYALDLSRQDVCDYVVDAIGKVLSAGNISYVKWDMNRNLTDVPRPGFYHECALGLYKIMSALTERFPDILFEGCAGGGGRFDPGLLAYMPQIWTSDDSDAVERLKIQYGTSMCYPVCSMGAHVTAVPNHQVQRITSLKTRADVAYAGVFGYELDAAKLTDEEKEEIRKQIVFAKDIQNTVFNGDLYRLRSPYEGNECVWEVAAEDRVFMMACRVLSTVNLLQHRDPKIRLRGLQESAMYRDNFTGKTYSGAMLMHRGIAPEYPQKDFSTIIWDFVKIS